MKKESVVTEKAPLPIAPYAQAIKAGGLVFLSGNLASDFKQAVAEDVRKGSDFPTFFNPIRLQTDYIYNNISTILEAAGSSLDRVIKTLTINESMEDFPGHLAIRQKRMVGPPSASTAIEALPPLPGCRVVVDVIGVDKTLEPEYFNTDKAPRPLAPYSQAVRAGDFWFMAGVLASDFKTGVAKEAKTNTAFPLFESSIEKQTEFVLDTIATILAETGSSLDRVVKAQVTLADINDFYGYECVWKRYFPADPPARSTYQGGLVNPGMLIEVDVIALAGDSRLKVENVETNEIPEPCTHQPQALKVGDWIFTSEILPTDYRTGISPEARINPNFPNYKSRGETQMSCCLDYLQKLLGAAGSGMEQVVKTWTFHTDLGDLSEALVARENYYAKSPPASSTIGTGGLVVPECAIMTEAIAISEKT